jgi:hypothetical protein
MSNDKVEHFTLHNNRGQSALDSELVELSLSQDPSKRIYGPFIRHSWQVNGQQFESDRPGHWCLLPDASGFICFERERKPDNCVLLDAYGNERMRLTVPWQLTRHAYPESGKSPTHFDYPSEPHINPATGEKGSYGVEAWIEYAGKYYFELNYRTGQFLWGKEIRD